MRSGRATRHLWGAAAALLLGTSACSSATTTLSDDSVAASVRVTPAAQDDTTQPTSEPPASAPTATPAPASPTPDPTPTPTAAPVDGSWADGLAVGDCFNNIADADAEEVAGPAIDCQGEHEYEIFLLDESGEGPDAAYPTGAEFTDGLFETFCDPATLDFAGASWDRVPVATTVWTPSAVDWANGDRAFACTAEAGLRSENIYKVGTAAGGTLVSDEGIVGRATVDGQRDLYFSFQGSTIYPLTDGEFEIPNTTPQVLQSGLLFASPMQDSEFAGNGAFDYAFEGGVVTQLDTGLAGWEIASPHLVLGIPAFLFAARETETDDWDLYLSSGSDDVVAIADSDGDDRWPTLTPDQSQVVFHSDGDIWIMNVDGTNKRQLTTDPGGDFESAVSPDGSQILFASDRSGNDDIWIMNVDGTDQRNLTNHPANEAWSFFSADGQTIYFQTDRLGVRSNIMIMELDGSNQSYYSFEFMTNAALLPDDVTARFATELPSLAEVRSNSVSGVVPGLAGAVAEIAHSSGRLMADLPVGWQYEEGEPGTTSLLAAPSTAAFSTSWAADGVLLSVVDQVTSVDVDTMLDDVGAATDDSCVLDDESIELAGSRVTTQRTYSCGTDNTAVVIGIYDSDTGTGMIFEGQWDQNPSDAADEAFIMAIAESLQWS